MVNPLRDVPDGQETGREAQRHPHIQLDVPVEVRVVAIEVRPHGIER
jgi:hypothetical protein